MNLNQSQLQAVTCDLGPTLVIAGPGSGKTHVIINRINYMIHTLGCNPRHILVVTFSKLAAEEMKERFFASFEPYPVTFGTLHSIFYRILRRANPQRYDLEQLILDDKKKGILQNLLVDLECDEGEEFMEGFLKHLSLMKNQLISPENYYPDGISREAFFKLYTQYEAYKERHGKFDFDDMLVECYHLLKNDTALLKAVQMQYQHVLIDEFQDINAVQFEIIKLLTADRQHLFVVGDDDQSIYQFRGAKPAFLLEFKKHFPNVQEIFLNTNYRSTKSILHYSLSLIEGNHNRYAKKLVTPNDVGEIPKIIPCKDAKEESLHIVEQINKYKQKDVPLKEMAVIYRTNIQARPLVATLLAANIPFCIRDGMVSLYDQWITQDLLSYLHLAQNINQPHLAMRIINKPKRYISQAAMKEASALSGHLFMNLLSLDSLTEWQKNYLQQLLFDLQVVKEKPLGEAITYIRKNIGYDDYVVDYAAYRKIPVASLLEMLEEIEDSASGFDQVEEWQASLMEMAEQVKIQNQGKNKRHDVLTLTTMHGSKGLEFQHVFIMDVVAGTIPHHKSQSLIEEEEERRLLYVGMTRAKKSLFLYTPSEKHGKLVEISPFINEIQLRHFKEKLQVGRIISHKQLGKGKIIGIVQDHILIVEFNNGKRRKIDSQYCIKNAIITWEDEYYEK